MAVLVTATALTFASAASAAPPEFFSLTAGGPLFGKGGPPDSKREAIWDEVQASGVKKFRFRFRWIDVASPCSSTNFDWGFYDSQVRRAATRGITFIANLYGVTGECGGGAPYYPEPQYPAPGTTGYQEWLKPEGFVYRVVKRYGYNGSFWAENPNVPAHPIQAWEVWNEENLPANNPGEVIDPHKYAKFLIDTSAAIHKAQAEISAADPVVVVGGLSTVGSVASPPTAFIKAMYNSPPSSGPGAYSGAELRAAFDGVGLHPYAFGSSPVAESQNRVIELRQAMNEVGDSAKSIWITEIGWPVSRYGITEEKQKNYLSEVLNWLGNNAAAYKLATATWYFLRDTESVPSQSWDLETGLKDVNGAYRPSWCAFLSLNGRSCARPVSSGTTPSISRDPTSGYVFMAYRNTEGGVSISYRSPGEGWRSGTLGGSVAPGTSPAVVRNEGAQHVFIAYRDTNGRISYWYWTQGEGWVNGTLGGNLSSYVAGGSSPALIWEPNFTAIYYRNSSGGLSYWYWTQTEGWVRLNLGGSIAPNTSPSVSRDPGSGYTFVAYTTQTEKIGYWLWSSSTGWVNGNLGGGSAAAGTSPSVVRNESAQHVFIAYTNPSGSISYWYWTTTEGWVNGTLSGGQPVWVPSSPSLVWDPNYTGIAYRNNASGLSMWYWVWPTGWTNYNVPTDGWLESNPAMTRDPATTDASIAYSNQRNQVTNQTWLFQVSGGWMQVVP